IRESVSEVFHTLRESVIIVSLVILLFLQDWKALLLPVIDVGVSLVGTFAVMLLLGFTLNNLTLFGLVLAIGIVVDDSIVVLENIERWLDKGLSVREATRCTGSSEPPGFWKARPASGSDCQQSMRVKHYPAVSRPRCSATQRACSPSCRVHCSAASSAGFRSAPSTGSSANSFAVSI